jgi:CRISPR-associated protein Cas2
MLFVVSYDMPSTKGGNRRRAAVARYLEGIGLRVQLSVFELDLPPEKMPAVYRDIEQRIEPKEDTVRIYTICAACAERVVRVGTPAVCEHAALLVW